MGTHPAPPSEVCDLVRRHISDYRDVGRRASHAAALEVQRNKTDKDDARGLAHLVRSGWYRPVHVKSAESHKLRLLLGHRRTLKRKLRDIENEIRHSLKVFGLRAGARVQRASFEARIQI